MDERKKKVLQAIVEEYVNTAEPVSSNLLTQKDELNNYSSATIRNEMADLEKSGYLEKTHTSSGRIPSEKGYRYYVDELLRDDNISIEEIKFVKLGQRMLMAVILTNSGMVKETIIKFDEDISDKQIETINYMFNKKLKGQPLEIIDVPLEKYLINEMKYSVKVIKPIIEQIKKVLKEERQLYLEGANKSFDLPEFNSLEVAKNFINIIDEKELMADMLDSGFAKDINVYIGDENEREQLKDFSIITFKHKVGNKDLGTIGIIGPKRMDYSKVISVMKYINKKLNEEDM